jgi:glycosyltransferase involved in cell wall biosynthesis
LETCKLCSNAALLIETHFTIGPQSESRFDAVYNARAKSFKRHELSTLVKSKVFLAYDWKKSDVDLDTFHPRELYRNIKGSEVAAILHKARVSLMLSQEEGACYASLEYLLCGMPVVSTPSTGGRSIL